MQLNECVSFLKEHDNYLILTHARPDGDTLGSAAALCHALRRIGKAAHLFKNEEITPKYLRFTEEYFAPAGYAARCTVAVDVAEASMLAEGFSGSIDLCIDHHPSNSRYAENLLLWGGSSSCGQIVLEVIESLCGAADEIEAGLLYMAISTDTGCFQYSNTNADTFRAAAKTLDAGADIHALNQLLFRRTSIARLRLEGMICAGLKVYRGGSVAVATVTLDMMERAAATENDCDDLAGISGRVEGAQVSVTIRELEPGRSKISVRSDPTVNSSDICAVYGGGGHNMAAGCTIEADPEKACEKILLAIDKVMG